MRLLDQFQERYGRLRTGVWVSVGCFAVICGTGLFILMTLVLKPIIAALPYSASTETILSAIFPWILAFSLLLIVTSALLLHFGLILPVESRRAQLMGELKNAPPREQIQMLMHERKELGEQLDAVLSDNLEMRDELAQLRSLTEAQRHRQHAIMQATNERVLITDEQAVIVSASPAMSTALGVRSNEVAGKAASDLLRLYDAGKERPMEYPIRGLVSDAITRASTIPQLQEVMLVDHAGKQQRLMISAEAIVTNGGVVNGALVRLESLEDAAESRGRALSAGQQRDVTTDLPMRESFERRLTELVTIAKNQDVTHSLLLLAVDNLQLVYDDYGYWAGEELLWQVSRLVAGEVEGQVELFRVTAMHFCLLVPFEPPARSEKLAERVRLAVDAYEFAWQNRAYQSSVSIAITPVDSHAQGNSALMSLADAELRAARDLGGNRVQTHVTDELLAETQVVEEKLMGWLESDGDDSRLQLQSMELSGGKSSTDKPLILAMLRVEMEDGFWVDPAAFVSSAKNSGLSNRIDAWLVRQSLQALADKPQLADSHGNVLVTLNGESLGSDDFADELSGVIAAGGIDPKRLTLCIDSAFARARTSIVTKFIARLESLGVGIALSGVRGNSLVDLVPRLKPRLLLLHSAVHANPGDPLMELQLEFFHSTARHGDYQIAVPEAVDADKAKLLYRQGVDFVGVASKGFGPLSAFDF